MRSINPAKGNIAIVCAAVILLYLLYMATNSTAENPILNKMVLVQGNYDGQKNYSATNLEPNVVDCGYFDETVAGKRNYVKRLALQTTCDDVFQRWMQINLKTPPTGPPPKEMPADLRTRYTLNNQVKVIPWYMDERSQGKKRRKRSVRNSAVRTRSVSKRGVSKRCVSKRCVSKRGVSKRSVSDVWTKDQVEAIINQLKAGNWALGPGYSTNSLAGSMSVYKPLGHGLVVGSLSPWVEGAALFFGATSVLTPTYNELTSMDPRITTTHPRLMAERYKEYIGTFEWAASYSSIEHSGLGRYGDNLDPEADIFEMQKVRCWLKDGGIFYFGVPVSTFDAIAWNVHRIYGPLRLAYMLAGFEVIATIHDHKSGRQVVHETFSQAFLYAPTLGYHFYQPTFVLKKLPMDNKC